jgi:hypothetical protein
MAKPAKATAPSDNIELYDKLVAANPNVERKGDTVPYRRSACRPKSGSCF